MANLYWEWAIPEKSPSRWDGVGQGDWGHTFLKKPLNFQVCRFILGNFRQNEASPLENFHKIVTPLGISRAKNQAFLYHHPWKFQFFFNWPLEFLHYIFSIYPQEISCPHPSPLVRIFSVTQLSHKIQTGGAEDIVFWKSPSGIFKFVTLPLEILEKTSFNL